MREIGSPALMRRRRRAETEKTGISKKVHYSSVTASQAEQNERAGERDGEEEEADAFEEHGLVQQHEAERVISAMDRPIPTEDGISVVECVEGKELEDDEEGRTHLTICTGTAQHSTCACSQAEHEKTLPLSSPVKEISPDKEQLVSVLSGQA